MSDAVRRANIPEAIRLIDQFFGGIPYSLTSLFADEQHRILRTILDRTLSEMETSLRSIYEDHASLHRFLTVRVRHGRTARAGRGRQLRAECLDPHCD